VILRFDLPDYMKVENASDREQPLLDRENIRLVIGDKSANKVM
jgi:hypothetical protein